ncbi:MAG: phospholipase D-like domain-containing protein [Chthoniobacter sp.]|uniref:phospholipase D-like domain-containing protein n=1 Tax=Chthoniobacter sp. TaxID=2510640 RepID=UPI0032ACCFC5
MLGLPALIVAALGLSGCTSVRRLHEPLPAISAIHSPDFAQATGSMLGASFLPGNRITTLSDGDAIFPAMLGAIHLARHTVTFETFVFHRGGIAQQFVDALAERARAGVEVKMIVDDLGSFGAGAYFAALRAAGVQLEVYHPVFSADLWRLNYRTHRKLLVVDGKIGFIGGVGIGDEWHGHSSGSDEWRDLHYRVEGPVVAQLQAAFHSNWFAVHHEVILGPGYFPALTEIGHARAGAFFSAPQRGRYTVGLMYHLAIAGARESLLIENPYFVPDRALTEALCAAAQRGVKVKVIMPGRHIDFSPARLASRKRWPRLRAAGVELYEFRGTMLHSKLLVADSLFVSVGSANFDPRSLAINDEANLVVLDPSFAREQERVFESDLQRSRPVDLQSPILSGVIDLPIRWFQSTFERQF